LEGCEGFGGGGVDGADHSHLAVVNGDGLGAVEPNRSGLVNLECDGGEADLISRNGEEMGLESPSNRRARIRKAALINRVILGKENKLDRSPGGDVDGRWREREGAVHANHNGSRSGGRCTCRRLSSDERGDGEESTGDDS